MAATIKDIARETGVSIATVSRVLNNIGGYSKEVEERVLSAVKMLGYRKNETAISLVTKTTKTVGIIMPNSDTSFYVKIIEGIEEEAHARGFSVIVTHAGIGGEGFQKSLDLMAERRVDGIIVFSIFLSKYDLAPIESLNIPIVLVSSTDTNNKIPSIKVDDYLAAYTAVDYLIKQGHANIGLAGLSYDDENTSVPRIKGYIDALEKNQIPVKEQFIEYGYFGFQSGRRAMSAYLERKEPITAVFCASDETALGIISICYENHIVVPDDLSVVGYDNSRIAAMVSPPLTTISQPFHQMGKLACLKLLNCVLNGKKITSEIIPFELIERKSVKKNHEKLQETRP